MLEIMRSDYIRTARAKGLSEWTVLLKHPLRGGIIPVVSFTGPALAALLAGTVVVEKVFSIPGLGNIFIQAVLNRDDTLVVGIVAFLSILIMLFNLIVDISYGFLDPQDQVRLGNYGRRTRSNKWGLVMERRVETFAAKQVGRIRDDHPRVHDRGCACRSAITLHGDGIYCRCDPG